MKSRTINFAAIVLSFVMFVPVAMAQQSGAKKDATNGKTNDNTVVSGEDAGDYTIVGSIEFGYRGTSVDGDANKYRSDLNYSAGPRLFDSNFLMKSKDGKGGFLETFLISTTGWGGDPSGTIRFTAENTKWYRFDGSYRRFKYFRFVNNLANPNWVFSPATFSVPPNPITGQHGTDTRMKLGDFDLTILPKNRIIRFNVGYSPERYSGPAYTTYHVGGNDFNFLSDVKSRADDYRVGADATLGPIDLSFLQGFRRFRDDGFVEIGPNNGINLNPTAAALTSFHRNEPTRGTVDFTRLSAHTLIAKKLDITSRLIYSKSKTRSTWDESFTGRNWNPRISGWPPTPPASTPNTLNVGRYNVTATTDRPNTVFDLGATWLATDNFRLSNTFRVEDFDINGDAVFSDFFSITRGSGATLRTDTVGFSNLDAHRTTKYRKYQDTIEGDYQFNPRYAFHFGYRYGHRKIEEALEGYNLGSNGTLPSPSRVSEFEEEENHTHAFFGGFKIRPANDLTFFVDAERGTADNVFTRIGNYDYTNIRAKARYIPHKKLSLMLAFISKDNANPSEIAGVSLEDFGVTSKSRIFTSSLDWTPSSRVQLSGGYNYNWLNSDAIVDYFFNSVRHPLGHSVYYMRNSYFFIDTTVRIVPRATLYTAYRVNHDNGQGSRVASPTTFPGILISSYPMTYQSPEARLAIKLHTRVDWNVGYQYFNYNESQVVGPRPQNYHAHLPYTSLRIYFGRRE